MLCCVIFRLVKTYALYSDLGIFLVLLVLSFDSAVAWFCSECDPLTFAYFFILSLLSAYGRILTLRTAYRFTTKSIFVASICIIKKIKMIQFLSCTGTMIIANVSFCACLIILLILRMQHTMCESYTRIHQTVKYVRKK